MRTKISGLFIIAAVIGLSTSALQADVFLNEPFDYDPAIYTWLNGDNVLPAENSNTPWTYGGIQHASMTNENLSWPGYRDSGSGYEVHSINDAGFTYRNDVGWDGTNGFRYDAVLVRFDDITNLKTNWGVKVDGSITDASYLEHRFVGSCGRNSNSGRGNLLIKKDTNDTSKINFGICDYSGWKNDPKWDSTPYDPAQTFLLVMRFDPNPGAGATTVPMKLYINPNVVSDEPATADMDVKYRGLESKGFNIFGNPDINFEVDEWTAAPTWRELFPLPAGAVISIK